MERKGNSLVAYKRARFSTRLPADHLYSPSHFWMAREANNDSVWRVGFTKFATRMLGELVECEYEVKGGDQVEMGQVIGWVEGFKAASDLYCVMEGSFGGGNPILNEDACVIRSDPYKDGWLYRVEGQPDSSSVDVDGYVEILDETIDKMLAEGGS